MKNFRNNMKSTNKMHQLIQQKLPCNRWSTIVVDHEVKAIVPSRGRD
jgi:hypothetical protein